jgi:quercetin dioxygenase-like cupin family protein
MTFDVLENPLTGEYAVLRQSASSNRGKTVTDLYARPGAAVLDEHIHPGSTEVFTVVRGRLGLKLNGQEGEAGPGTRITVPPGTAHSWWNGGPETAWVLVEVDPGARFETMVKNMFFLAADGKTDRRGSPGWLQTAISAQEFDDTFRLAGPPRLAQQILFGLLAPIARLRGLRGSYPEYANRVSEVLEEVEALPPDILALLPAGVPRGTAAGPPPRAG